MFYGIANDFLLEKKKINILIFLCIITIITLFFFKGYYILGKYMPKPKGYLRIDLPKHEYISLSGSKLVEFTYNESNKFIFKNNNYDDNIKKVNSINKKSNTNQQNNIIKNFPYNFEVSKSAIIKKTPFGKYSIDIYYPSLKANIHITYKSLKGDKDLLKKYWNAAYKLTNLHQAKASDMKENVIENPNGLKVITIDIEGEDIASQFNFHTSDGKKHFFRGVLYFDHEPNQTFLSPMIKFMKKEIYHLIHTLKWNN